MLLITETTDSPYFDIDSRITDIAQIGTSMPIFFAEGTGSRSGFVGLFYGSNDIGAYYDWDRT